MDSTISIGESIWNQFGASLDMLENAIMMCKEEHWYTDTRFWYASYHCTFWTDYYLATDPGKFAPPAPFTLSEFDPAGKMPDQAYSKTEVLTYLEHCRQKAYLFISALKTDQLNERWINEHKNYTLLEILIYNIRHIQHHAAQLNLLLRQSIDKTPSWVSQAKNLNEKSRE